MDFRITQCDEIKLQFKSGQYGIEDVALLTGSADEKTGASTRRKLVPKDITQAINWDDSGRVEMIAEGQVQMTFHADFCKSHKSAIANLIWELAEEAALHEAESMVSSGSAKPRPSAGE